MIFSTSALVFAVVNTTEVPDKNDVVSAARNASSGIAESGDNALTSTPTPKGSDASSTASIKQMVSVAMVPMILMQ